MNEPARLLKGGATEFERLLLGAAIRERPSRLQRQRMRRAISLAQLGIFATSAKAVAGFATHVLVVAVVGTSLLGSGSSPIGPASHQPGEPAAASTVRSAKEPASRRPGVDDSVANDATATADHPTAGDPEPATVATEGRVRPVASVRRLPDLREEIALIDQARSALRSGAPTRALAALEQYRARYPRGSFGQEATTLRIEALAASGNRARAVAEANDFLRRNPNSPHTERLQRVILGETAKRR